MPFRAASIILAATLLIGSAPVHAERVLSADEFASMVAGRTLHFDRSGAAFGSEQYFEDGRVIWAFEGGTCQRGIWFSNSRGEICFVYDSDPVSQCWSFMEAEDGRFRARLSGDAPSEDLITRDIGSDDLDCPAPDLGV